ELLSTSQAGVSEGRPATRLSKLRPKGHLPAERPSVSSLTHLRPRPLLAAAAHLPMPNAGSFPSLIPALQDFKPIVNVPAKLTRCASSRLCVLHRNHRSLTKPREAPK